MLGRLYVVINSEDDLIYQRVKNEILELNEHASISPMREYASAKNHSEFFVTLNLTEKEANELLAHLNNDWTGDSDDCESYGFNTQMFDEAVHYLQFTLFD